MLRIHKEFNRQALPNCTKLARLLVVPTKTVLRDIAFMRHRLDLPIEFDSRIQAYRYTEPVTSFPTVQISEGELMALASAHSCPSEDIAHPAMKRTLKQSVSGQFSDAIAAATPG